MSLLPKPVFYTALALFGVIVLAPLALIFGASFFELSRGLSVLALDSRQLALLKNSLSLGLGAGLISTVLGVVYAFLVTRTDLPAKKFFHFASVLPLFIPAYINAVGWVKLSDFLPGFSVYGLGGAILVLSLAYFPFMVLFTQAGLHSLDKRLEEAGLLRWSKTKVARKITLPLIAPYILSGVLLVFIFAISEYGVPDLLRVNTYPVEIFIQFSAFYDTAKAAVLSLPLVLVTFSLIMLERKFMGDKAYLSFSARSGRGLRFCLNKFKLPAVLFCSLVLLLAVIVPLAVLAVGAGPLSSYTAAFKTARSQIFVSLVLAAAGATLITLLSIPLGYMIQRGKGVGLKILDSLTLAPFAIPGAVLGIGLIKLWNHPATNFIYGTFLIIILGYAARFIAFSVRAVSSSLSQIPASLEDAARLVCPSRWKSFCRIVLPLALPGILAGWCLSFALCLAELATTLLVAPAGEATLPIRIYTLMHYGAHKLVCGLCLIVTGIILAGMVLVYQAYRLSRKGCQIT